MNHTYDRDIEQIDYGYGYKAQNSPQQHMSLKVDGGMLALAFAILAFGGVLVAAIFIPSLMESRAKAAVEEAVRPIAAKVASLESTSYIAEREARVSQEDVKTIRMEMAKAGLYTDAKHP